MLFYKHRQDCLCRPKHDGDLNKRHERLEYLGVDIGCIHSVPLHWNRCFKHKVPQMPALPHLVP